MVGPYKLKLQGPAGVAVRMYVAASAAVGSYLPCDKSAIPNASSPDSVRFNKPVQITDVISTTAAGAAGAFEVIKDGNPTGVIFEVDANYSTNTARQKFNFLLEADAEYRFRVVEGFPA